MKILALSTLLVSAACHGQGHSHALRYAHDVGFKFTAPAAGAPEQIWLNLGASVDQMVVTWITAASANTTVQFGTTPGSLTSTATGNQSTYTAGAYTSGFIHRATMAGLKAASTVYYRVSGPSGTWSDVITFNVSRSGPVYPFKLAVLGDIGQTNNSNATVNYVLASQQVESVVIAGDLSYADSEQPRWDSFGRMMTPLSSSIPVMTCPGNHELELTLPFFLAYQSRFDGMPFPTGSADGSQYYSYETGPVHVIILNAFGIYSAGSPQYTWLEKDLAGISYTKTPWVIAVLHTPFYCSNTAHSGSGDLMRLTLEDMFVNAKVSLVLSGHIHAVERTTNVVNGAVNASGPMHITIGDGGNREGLYTNWQTPSPVWSVFRAAEYGGATLEFLNSTHALWQWHRNVDPEPIVTDSAYIPNVNHAVN